MSRLLRLSCVALTLVFALQASRVEAGRPGSATIAELVVASANADEPQFTILLAALEYTGLAPVFAGKQPYTVFAPTDEAFLNLLEALEIAPAGTLVDTVGLIDAKLGEGTVAKVLLFHVTRGVRLSQSVVGNKEIDTLNGQPAIVDGTTIEGANIIGTDLRAKNGVIHIIDAVIVPDLSQ